ncbi:MAG: hypothetical protein ACTS73_06315 [Arsenophonus sp. NEOnobi-MAG3]
MSWINYIDPRCRGICHGNIGITTDILEGKYHDDEALSRQARKSLRLL